MTKKVFDIVPPGKALASPTSRPVIASGKPAVQDGQITQPRQVARISEPDERRPLMRGGEKVRLSPVSKDAQPAGAPAVPPVASAKRALSSLQVPEKLLSAEAPSAHLDDAATKVALSDAKAQLEPAVALTPEIVAAAADVAVLPAEERTEDPIPDTPDVQLGLDELAAISDLSDKPAASPHQQVAAVSDGPPSQSQTPGAASEPPAANLSGRDERPQVADAPDDLPPATAKPAYRREDLLSGAGMVMPEDTPQRMIVSQHKAEGMRVWQWALVVVLIIVVAVAALNFLIDAEIIQTDLQLPTTNLL